MSLFHFFDSSGNNTCRVFWRMGLTFLLARACSRTKKVLKIWHVVVNQTVIFIVRNKSCSNFPPASRGKCALPCLSTAHTQAAAVGKSQYLQLLWKQSWPLNTTRESLVKLFFFVCVCFFFQRPPQLGMVPYRDSSRLCTL